MWLFYQKKLQTKKKWNGGKSININLINKCINKTCVYFNAMWIYCHNSEGNKEHIYIIDMESPALYRLLKIVSYGLYCQEFSELISIFAIILLIFFLFLLVTNFWKKKDFLFLERNNFRNDNYYSFSICYFLSECGQKMALHNSLLF